MQFFQLFTFLLTILSIGQSLPIAKRALATITADAVTQTVQTYINPEGYKTVTTEVDGVLGTYLQQVVTVTTHNDLPTSSTTQNKAISSPTTTTTSTTSTSSTSSSSSTEITSPTPTSTPTTITSTSSTSSSTSSSTTSSSTSTSTSITTTSSTSSSTTSEAPYTAYETDKVGGTCFIYYAQDDLTATYSDDTTTTMTVTSVIATVTLNVQR